MTPPVMFKTQIKVNDEVSVDLDRNRLKINDRIYDPAEMKKIVKYYDILRIAEFIYVHYETPAEMSWNKAVKAKDLIDTYYYTETEAIDSVMSETK